MKTYTVNHNEAYLLYKLDRLETVLYRIKRSLLKWGIGLAFILVVSEGLVYSLFHAQR